ncbi:MAG: 16S rRNA (cytidine1402-2'-O)-methyltransferase [Rickettsiales bacterium]|jgi:16S rRNA (cytidine1402-2'-O)-methyltransferase
MQEILKENQAKITKELVPALYVVATPIGNLGDITLRAIEVLKKCDFVVCEDSRVTGKLLNFFEIKKPFIVYNDHSGEIVREKILSLILQGKSLALVSDAGTPLISDPGYKLVEFLRNNNCQILSIPGACSAIAALCVSGIGSARFMFCGFVPHVSKTGFFKELVNIESSLIFFESPSRLVKTLKIMKEIFGNRMAAISREITKFYEQTKKDTLENLIDFYEQNPPRGEIVILLSSPLKKGQADGSQIDKALKKGLGKMKPKELVAAVAEELKLGKKEVYQRMLELTK